MLSTNINLFIYFCLYSSINEDFDSFQVLFFQTIAWSVLFCLFHCNSNILYHCLGHIFLYLYKKTILKAT